MNWCETEAPITSRETETPTTEFVQQDSDLKLVEQAFNYIIGKKYPADCSKNDKRSIRHTKRKEASAYSSYLACIEESD